MAINKVEFGNQTLMDLTGDTVTPEDVLNGATFHDRAGVSRSGTASYPVTDVQVNNTSVLDGTVAKVTVPTNTSDLTNDSDFVADASYVHTDNNYTTTEKNKLSGIASGAEVNQNAFSNIKVGNTTISADSKTDTVELVAGSNVTLTPDASTDKITIAAIDTTYSDATTSTSGLMSASDKTKLNGVATGAEVNQNAFSRITVGSTNVDADSKTDALTLVAGNNVTITPDATNDKITIAATDTTYSEATTSAAGLMSASDKTKLNGIATGAEVNQNAFSNVKVGSTTVAADGKTDTLELVAGNNITLTPDATNDKVTIASTDTNNRRSFYGTCSTAADVADKEVTISDTDGWELKAGTVVGVKFANTNTASSVTLNINGTGAKSIWYNNAVYTSNSNFVCGAADTIIYYMYDGSTYWIWFASGKLDGNTDTKVTQTATSTSANYEVLFSVTADNTTRTEGARKNSNLKFNPSTGNLQATQLNGVTIGSSPKFTDTTYESKTAASGGTDVSLVTTGEKYTWNNKSDFSGSYNDLTNKPTLGTAAAKDTTDSYSASGTNPTTGKAVAAALGTLDVTGASNIAGSKTIKSWSETDGKVSITTQDISITKSQVSDFPTLGTAAAKNYTTSVTSGSSDLVTSGAVFTAIDNLPEPMVFRGSLGTNGTITTLPVDGSAKIGDTYKVITAGTYASKSAKVGDTFICLTKTSSANTWELIPSGDEPAGTVTSVAISNGGGLSVSGSPITSSGTITISHADTSSQASVNNSGRTYIQDITLDTYGHVTGIASATETVTNTDRYVNSAAFAYDSTNDNVKMTLTRAGSDTATVTGNIPKVSSSGAGVVPKGTAVSSQSQNTKFLREDGTWAKPSYTTNTNTTYTFANGTNGFTVTPSGGSAQTVTVTPNIADNVTGSGTNGYIAKFNGTNTITDGPAFGNGTTTYLRNDGTWATPTDTNNRRSFYGTCATAAGTAAKEVTITDTTGWELKAGTIIGVKFSNSNSASNVTLNVNSTGAKSIWYNNAVYTGNSNAICGYASRVNYYMYDGSTYWIYLHNGIVDSNSDTIPQAQCNTSASTAAKGASMTYYTATAKSYVMVNIRYANTSASAITLNINSTGAKPIYINGSASSASNYTLPAGSYLVYYDGTNYYFRTDGKITGNITGDAATVNGKTVAVNVPADAKFTDNNTTYTFATGDSNGQIKVTPSGGSAQNVSVKGLGSAAYTASTAYATCTTLTNENLNNVTTPGFYNAGGGNTVTNKPSGVDAFGLEVIHTASGNFYVQIIYANTTSIPYRRYNNNGTWSAWTQDKYTDTNTWTAMVGATSSANGSVGYVNATPPKDGYNTKFLRADGTWSVPSYPTVNNAAFKIQLGGTDKKTFTANASSAVTANFVFSAGTTPSTVTKKTVVTSATFNTVVSSATISGSKLTISTGASGSSSTGDSVTVTAGTAPSLSIT